MHFVLVWSWSQCLPILLILFRSFFRKSGNTKWDRFYPKLNRSSQTVKCSLAQFCNAKDFNFERLSLGFKTGLGLAGWLGVLCAELPHEIFEGVKGREWSCHREFSNQLLERVSWLVDVTCVRASLSIRNFVGYWQLACYEKWVRGSCTCAIGWSGCAI